MRFPSSLTQLALVATSVHAYLPPSQFGGLQVGPIEPDMQDTSLLGINGTSGWGTFDQLIDHYNPSKGTFKQRYWYAAKYYNGTGSPIFLFNPGEQSGDYFNITYSGNRRLPGLMAEKSGGAVVIVEHRYWGQSSPYESLTVENLQYLTLDQSLKDMTYFVKNFDAPFANGPVDPSTTPWVFTGGSYPGAMAGWLASLEPGVFWAYHGTSAVVEAISDYWQYFSPILSATPANCSADLVAVIDYIDDMFDNGTAEQKKALKDKFMLADLEDGDFANALALGPWRFQDTQFYSEKVVGYNYYTQFCDYIENVFPNSTNTIPGAGGVGVEKALDGYAKWFKEARLPGFCAQTEIPEFNSTLNIECLKYLNPDNLLYKDLTPSNYLNRQWLWMLCNEPFEYWQTAAPKGTPSIVSRYLSVEYSRMPCKYAFGEDYGLAKNKTVEQVNKHTGGWFYTNTTRLMYTNGQFDPWLTSTVSAPNRPGGPLVSTDALPARVVEGGTHCSDLDGPNWDVNPALKKLVDEEVDQMVGWVEEFYKEKNAKRGYTPVYKRGGRKW